MSSTGDGAARGGAATRGRGGTATRGRGGSRARGRGGAGTRGRGGSATRAGGGAETRVDATATGKDAPVTETADSSSAAAPARSTGGRGRPIIHNIETPDFADLSPNSKTIARKSYVRARNKAAQAKLRATKRRLQLDAKRAWEDSDTFKMRTLQAIGATPNGGFRARVAVGLQYESKAELMHAIREAGEFVGCPVKFLKNTTQYVLAVPHSLKATPAATAGGTAAKPDSSGEEEEAPDEPPDSSAAAKAKSANDSGLDQPGSAKQTQDNVIAGSSEGPNHPGEANFRVAAKYERKSDLWRITESVVGQRSGAAPSRAARRTAYPVRDLARVVEPILAAKPDAEENMLRTTLQDYIRFPGALNSNVIWRIRRRALVSGPGAPDENVAKRAKSALESA